MQKALGWFGSLYRPPQRFHDQVFGPALAQGVADDFPGAHVLVPDQVQPALIGGDMGDRVDLGKEWQIPSVFPSELLLFYKKQCSVARHLPPSQRVPAAIYGSVLAPLGMTVIAGVCLPHRS